jgi:type IV pilus assembly protein PilB
VSGAKSKLGEILVKERLITPDQLGRALAEGHARGERLGRLLIHQGAISEDDLTAALSRQYAVPSINLAYFEVDPDLMSLVPMEIAAKHLVLPVGRVGSTLTLAMVDPTNVSAMDDIKFMTGFNIEPVLASERGILEAIRKYYGPIEEIERKKEIQELVSFMDEGAAESLELEAEGSEALNLEELEKAAEEAPVIRLVNYILSDAVKREASDIHLEPYEKEYRIRYRIDGLLRNIMNPPLKLRDAMVSRLKIMAKLDISEKRLPQDGRIMIRLALDGKKKQIDFRVSVMPTLHGEKVVLRLLDKENLRLDMTRLGFEPESLAKFEKAIARPYGIILVTGPTGSGKTNTLYSSIFTLNQPDVNIVTAEDPVEFQLPGINQVQMKDQIGLNFAAALRSFLRQDPDIILVGEIRDFETAEIAIKAALTGHLVLSTLHTNDAPSTITRLINMGIEPFLVATSVNLIAAQRLVRTICPRCKAVDSVPRQALIDAGFTPEEAETVQVYKGKGCDLCDHTGYKGRLGLFEVLEITEELRDLILVGTSAIDLKRKALEQGMLTLRRSGLQKVKSGLTTLEEVVRETVR